MNSNFVQIQLNVIEYLLKDVELSYTKSDYFEKALSGLSDILRTSLLIHTSVYKDKNNKEYQLTHNFFSKNTKTDSFKHSTTKFAEDDKPLLFDTLYKESNQIVVKKSQLLNNFFGKTDNSFDSSNDEDYNIVSIKNGLDLSF